MLAGPEARKGVIEMCTYLEERAGNAATQLAKRLDKLSVASPTAAPNGTSQPSEDSDETVEQILGVHTPLRFLCHPLCHTYTPCRPVYRRLCLDMLF